MHFSVFAGPQEINSDLELGADGQAGKAEGLSEVKYSVQAFAVSKTVALSSHSHNNSGCILRKWLTTRRKRQEKQRPSNPALENSGIPNSDLCTANPPVPSIVSWFHVIGRKHATYFSGGKAEKEGWKAEPEKRTERHEVPRIAETVLQSGGYRSEDLVRLLHHSGLELSLWWRKDLGDGKLQTQRPLRGVLPEATTR
ncbi:hypothetical protein H920_08161 [Fukomys damarensis]|uniref:Uncharacterized protein n=1 Tax=Fukomys damarensis TaxID=885580 RepID=A0A091DJK2_FUKDA|nr:hypothetical protein H920_08161 [Fukomys damarensis]